ncbi:coiled-coil domain-containing protein 50 isoform X2 [Salminus brasiliensis]|uniref:coiled-coil domain-containing protein 50 isoform X2 n=1 Tax=Salminus brasiliensis TaxID=930266 RepID=UPI003B839CCF
MDDLSIDQKKLPGVKEVCRDFAVLEDHCLAHNLQEQEIENHLASNIHKSRLVQQDLRVAKRLQEEEDLRAKAQNRRQHKDIERIDNEIAQEIQEQLVWQAEQQRQQEQKDEAIARKLQEREMKEERKRKKQLEANFEEQYYEDKGAHRPPSDPRMQNPSPDSPLSSRERYRDLSQGQSQDHRSPKLDQKRRHDQYAEYYPAETGRSRPPELYNAEGTRGKHDGKGRRPEHYIPENTKYPEEYLSERGRHLEAEYSEHRRDKKYQTRDQWDEPPFDQEPMASMKDRPYRDKSVDRDKAWDKENDRARRRDRDREREREKDGRRNRERVQYQDRERSPDKLLSVDASRDQRWNGMELDVDTNGYKSRNRENDLDRQKERRGAKDAREKDRNREKQNRDGSRGRELDNPSLPWARSEENLEDADYGRRHGANELFEEPSSRGRSGEPRSPEHPSRERGRIVRGEYGVKEATQGLAQMDLREQELIDMEVARKLQEEELKASQLDKRAAQVAQDEEIARRLMEEEKREFKRSREKEKQAMDRQQKERRAEGDFKPTQEDVVRPRTREEFDYQRARNNPKPTRPPPPRTPNYENVDSSYMYPDHYSPRPPARPDPYKGAYSRP